MTEIERAIEVYVNNSVEIDSATRSAGDIDNYVRELGKMTTLEQFLLTCAANNIRLKAEYVKP